MKPYVYILYSKKTDKYYIGSTSNLQKRMKHHLGGYTPSTRRMQGIELMFSQKCETLQQARFIERRLKRLKRRDYIENIIKEGVIRMHA